MNGGLYSVEAKDFDRTLGLSQVKSYGDTVNDGKVQLSFALPVPKGAGAEKTTKSLPGEMRPQNPMAVFSEELAKSFTFFNCYGSCTRTINYSSVYVPKVESTTWDMEETDELIRIHIGRELAALGASTSTDTHTVGIDAIMNMKGFAGHYGLERYDIVDAYNLGNQIPDEELVAKGIETNADAPLVSQTVTQKDVHIKNMAEFIEPVEAEGLRNKIIIICGGPRISHELAKELGFDTSFGANTFADDVVSSICQEIVRRKEAAGGK